MIYKFNNFEVNQELREVFYLGEAQVVQPKVFDLLVFLIQNRNRAVSKNEIQDVVWANLEISETAMTRAIMKARKVLSVDEKKQPFIKTIHGHGYRFMPEVQEIEHNPNVSGTSKSTTSSPKNKSLLGILAFAVMCSLIVIGVIYSNQDKFTSDSRIAILPFIDKTNNQDYNWTSKGLMGLSTEIIKAQNNVKTVSTSQTSKVISTYNDLDLSAQEINDLKQSLQASHLVLVELLLQNSGVFNLNYVVYHPKGKQDIITLTGENPTELSQKMSKNIINMISGSSISHKKYRVISDKPFTNELYARGIALRLEGKAKQARDYFKLAMAEDSGLFWPRYQYALTSRMIGLYDDSINELKKLKQELPQLATNDKDLATGIQNALGTAYMRKSENKQGLKHYENAYNLAVENDNIDYAVKIATNIAWIYKDQRNFQQSRIWVSKSMQMLKEHNLPPLTNNLYLLGQLEYRMNHFNKAKSIFEQVFQIYMKENKKRNAAKVLNSLSSLASKTGNWTISQDYNNQSSKIFIEIKSDINLLNNKITQTSLYINQGEYSKASVLLDEIIAQSKTLDLEHKHIQILQTKIKLLFKKKNYPQVITVFNNLPSIKQSKINQIDQSEVLNRDVQ